MVGTTIGLDPKQNRYRLCSNACWHKKRRKKLQQLLSFRKKILARKLLELKYEVINAESPETQWSRQWKRSASNLRKTLPSTVNKTSKKQNLAFTQGIKIIPSASSATRRHGHKSDATVMERAIGQANSTKSLQILENSRCFSNCVYKSSMTILMEVLRSAMFRHDWLVVSKCVEGLANEFTRRSLPYFILWNGGFLALVNLKRELDKVIEFSHHAQIIIRSFPLRLGIEIATWLTQKGKFGKAFQLLTEIKEKYGKHKSFQLKRYDTPKRYRVELVATIFFAFHSYWLWKLEWDKLTKSEQEKGGPQGIRRLGEAAFQLFEQALVYADKCKADVTFFIKEWSDLAMQYRDASETQAKFLQLSRKHGRNLILEQLYMEYLQQHFPTLDNDIDYYRKHLRSYTFESENSNLETKTLRSWKQAMLHKKNRSIVFIPKELPNYKFEQKK